MYKVNKNFGHIEWYIGPRYAESSQTRASSRKNHRLKDKHFRSEIITISDIY
jgi:hypothetical protein